MKSVVLYDQIHLRTSDGLNIIKDATPNKNKPKFRIPFKIVNLDEVKYKYLSRLDLIPMTLREVEEQLCHLMQDKEQNNKMPKSKYDSTLIFEMMPNLDDLIQKVLDPQQEKDLYKEPIVDSNNLLPYINSWLKCVVNQLYLEYCKSNSIIPKGIISIPKHLVNEIFNTIISKDRLLERVNRAIGRYIGKNGKVYFSCCEKAIEKSLISIEEKRKSVDDRRPSSLLPDYSREEPMNFKVKRVTSLGSKMDLESVLEIKLARKVINKLIHPRYRMDEVITVDNKKCETIIGGRLRLRASHSPNYGMFIAAQSRFYSIVHEYIHCILEKSKQEELYFVSCDFMYENTKGSEIIGLNGFEDSEKYKPLNRNMPLLPYATKMYDKVELYGRLNEMLPIAIGTNLLDKIDSNWDSIISKYIHKDPSLSNEQVLDEIVNCAFKRVYEIIEDRFDKMVNESSELGAFTLGFTNGEYKTDSFVS